MGWYNVRYVASPAVPFDDYIVFVMSDRTVGDISVKIASASVGGDVKTRLPPEIAIDFQMKAQSLDVALDISFRHSNLIVSVLSYLASTGLPRPVMKLAFDFSEDAEEHDFLQVVDLNVRRREGRSLSPERMKGFLLKTSSLSGKEAEECVLRAIRWYSHGLQETNPFFRLLACWFSLESLEPILRKDDELRDKSRRRSSRRIGERKVKTPGVMAFMEQLGKVDKDLYEKARKLRNKTVHPTWKMGEIKEKAPDLS